MDPLKDLLTKSFGYPIQKYEVIDKCNLKLYEFKHTCEKLSAIGGVYWIEKDSEDWIKILECVPHKNSLAPCAPKSFSVCYEHPQKPNLIGLPRFLGLSIFGIPQKDIRTNGLDFITRNLQLRPQTNLRDYQLKAVQQTKLTLEKWGGATIIADCGAGKTLMGISIAIQMQKKTLVVCNRSFLMQQWKNDIQGKGWTWSDDNKESDLQLKQWRIKCDNCKTKFLIQQEDKITKNCKKCNYEFMDEWCTTIEPQKGWIDNVKVGWLQGSDKKFHDIENKDFVITSIESISQCNYSKEILGQFGTVIIDEMHHLGALTLSQVLPLIPTKYVLGITATPERNDGLEHVLYWLAGPTSFVYKRLPSITGKINTVIVKPVLFCEGQRKEIFNYNGSIGYAQMVSLLSEDEKRNDLIIKTIKENIDRKKILVITTIVDHGKCLLHLLQGIKTVFIHGGCKPGKIALAKTDQIKVVIATYQFLEEGYDDNTLDTLIMALPRSKIQQVVGRCERTHEGKLVPIIYDIIDTFSVFEAMRWKRYKFYKSRGFHISA